MLQQNEQRRTELSKAHTRQPPGLFSLTLAYNNEARALTANTVYGFT